MAQSVMNHSFGTVPTVNTQRSTFQRNHGLKTAFDANYLIPIFWDEAYPGDTHSLRLNAFGRLATPIYPIMDNLHIDYFFFAVPIRLIWDNWERFNGAQDAPGDSTDYLVPEIEAPSGGYQEQTLADYFGLPTKVAGYVHSALYFRAYNLIYNEWFRDQNLVQPVPVEKGDGPDDPTAYKLVKRGKRHDYFTSCLPWPQKDNGNPVLLPIGATADVVTKASATDPIPITLDNGDLRDMYVQTTPVAVRGSFTGNPDHKLFADLSNATAATINDLREAFQVQRMFEKDARGGTRYVEVIKNHFQVVSPDFRLQRPEYLGGGHSMVNIHPVTQTTPGTPEDVQGSLAAFGTTSTGGNIGFTKSFTEHCLLIGLASLRADLTYQDGVDRAWSRRTRFDWFWPSLANLGEQAVLNKEIYVQGNATDDGVFGYQERWAELRYKNSKITGRFRSNATQSLDPWHLSQDFANLPVLGPDFIEENVPMDRVIAVTTEPDIIWDGYFIYRSARPLPVNSVPGLIDHF